MKRTLALLAVLLAAGCGGETSAPESAEPEGPVGVVEPAGLDVATVRAEVGERALLHYLPGEALPAPEFYAVVSAPIGGRIASIYAHEGEPVRRGQVLLHLESTSFAEMVADYLEAVADVSYYRSQAARVGQLVERKISPAAALEKADSELARSEARMSATFGRLRALDMPARDIEALPSASRDRPLLPVYAPISGVIDEHRIDLGTSVAEYQELLTLVNPSRVLVRAFADPEDLGSVTPGMAVRVGRRSGDLEGIDARVTSVAPALDAETRSLALNIMVDAHRGFPVPGQSVRVALEVPTAQPVIALPMSALVYDGERPSVFVAVAPGQFRLTAVEVLGMNDEQVLISSGLQDGDEVAVSEVFALKALTRYGEYAEE